MLRTYMIRNSAGLHYSVRIFIGTSVLWLLLHNAQTSDSLWAIISLIVVTEPQTRPALKAFYTRFFNTVMGCAVAFGFLLLPLPQVWMLTPAIGTSALIATRMNSVQQGWRIAPVTTGLIMSGAMVQHATPVVFDLALHRTMEVFVGSITAVIITLLMGVIWLPVENKVENNVENKP